ncbi:MAG: hypothetical protein K0U74_04445 [Alphaproteobacteria bacterium]|nr:hypothetical protein [Alphaproteobacteria bacterium]
MLKKMLAAAVAVLTSGFVTTAQAADYDDWARILEEQRTVIDVVNLRGKIGRFTKVRLVAVNGPVEVIGLRLKFVNGSSEDFKLKVALNKGEGTTGIDLPGKARRIAAAEIRYRYLGKSKGQRGHAVLQGLIANEPGGYDVMETANLGTKDREVTLRLDRGDKRVGSIRLRAWVDTVLVRSAEIVFANGDRQKVKIRDRLEPGEATDPIDLQGDRRKVKQVVLKLRPQRGRSEYARIDLLGKAGYRYRGKDRRSARRDRRRSVFDREGRRGRDREIGRGWSLLGSRKAGLFKKDDDVFKVGKSKGRYTGVRVRARGADVRMYGMTIVYANGRREEVPIYGTLEQDEISEPFDLKGKARFIDRIEFQYRTKLNLRGQAEVELWGKSRRSNR